MSDALEDGSPDVLGAALLAADAYDAAESARLNLNEPAFTDGHFYFAQGDIEDVYFACALPDRGQFVFSLTRCDPLADDDQALASRLPLFRVSADGSVWLVEHDGGENLAVWICRDFLPFGRTQAGWLASLRATGSIAF